MPDVLVLLLVILAAVVVWRGPKTLPKLGQALGRSVKEVRREIGSDDDEKAETPESPTPDRPA